jgi:A/G-specific adenine glycosylase
MRNLTIQQIKKFQKEIWNFYKKQGRSMPWRREKDPYKVLISEIMLQQTQVSRVIPKYLEFVKEFPDFKTLAEAKLSSVLEHWSGLGYNRRALFLQKLAQEVTVRYKGVLPNKKEALIALPGIGKATVGSILAFAFNEAVPFIETNIRRVYIDRFFKNEQKIHDDKIFLLVEKTIDRKNPREWYYALMDYGAMLKVKTKNPNQKSVHYVKQSKFVGSDREIRGILIKYLTEHASVSQETFLKKFSFSKERVEKIFERLQEEGMIEKRNKLFRIKS